MEYFDILNLNREPFSNSPDPEFFYEARPHVACLQKLELALRLRRGLSVITGEVGTGKTTLCRHLIRRFAGDDQAETHLILDPSFSTPMEFLRTVAELFLPSQSTYGLSDWQIKENIKKYLLQRGVDENRLVILLIDEGQRLPDDCLEILREFLNYETNDHKLLQIVIFAQKEFDENLKRCRGFADRISLYQPLDPLNFRETRALIRFRLERAGQGKANPTLLSLPAMMVIYRACQGYPRKAIHLCHQVVLSVIIQNRTKAGWLTARSCAKRFRRGEPARWSQTRKRAFIFAAVAVLILGTGAAGFKMLEFRGKSPTPVPPMVVKQDVGTRPVEPVNAPPEVLPAVGIPPAPGPDTGSDKAGATALAAEGGDTAAAVPADMAVKPAPETRAPDKTIAPAKGAPAFLGYLTVARGSILTEMISGVYGASNRKRIALVRDANPATLHDPDLITPGQRIRFPAVRVTPSGEVTGFYWVQAAEKGTLEEAYHFLRSYPREIPAVHIVPTWKKGEGLRFHILCREPFSDEESAQKRLLVLSTEIASAKTVLADWGKDRVFFADPFDGALTATMGAAPSTKPEDEARGPAPAVAINVH